MMDRQAQNEPGMNESGDARPLRVLITAGPTREPLDPVRYLSNRSSGKMGYALASAAVALGHRVTLVSGPVALAPPDGCRLVAVETAAEMHAAVERICRQAPAPEVAVLAAAVADFRPATVAASKLKKGGELRSGLQLRLEPTEDILAGMRSRFGFDGLLVGFAAETGDLIANAMDKLRRKRCDLMVANPVGAAAGGAGFDSDENILTLCYPDGRTEAWGRDSKDRLAVRLMELCTRLSRKLQDQS